MPHVMGASWRGWCWKCNNSDNAGKEITRIVSKMLCDSLTQFDTTTFICIFFLFWRKMQIKTESPPCRAMTRLVGWQEGHPARKNVGCWFVGGDCLTGALHILYKVPMRAWKVLEFWKTEKVLELFWRKSRRPWKIRICLSWNVSLIDAYKKLA